MASRDICAKTVRFVAGAWAFGVPTRGVKFFGEQFPLAHRALTRDRIAKACRRASFRKRRKFKTYFSAPKIPGERGHDQPREDAPHGHGPSPTGSRSNCAPSAPKESLITPADTRLTGLFVNHFCHALARRNKRKHMLRIRHDHIQHIRFLRIQHPFQRAAQILLERDALSRHIKTPRRGYKVRINLLGVFRIPQVRGGRRLPVALRINSALSHQQISHSQPDGGRSLRHEPGARRIA